MIERIIDQGAAVGLDDTYFPVLITTWSGRASETTVRGFYAWAETRLARAKAQNLRVVQISDASDADRPDPVTRRLFAQLTDAHGEAFADTSLATFVVLESAVLRGAMTAIGWLTRRNLDLVVVANMAAAIRRAREALVEVGQPPPSELDPSVYRRPVFHRNVAG